MPYALLDDGFHSDPKLEAIGLAGKGLIANAFSYCGQWLTDGFVPLKIAQGWATGKQRKLLDLLVEQGILERVNGGSKVTVEDKDGRIITLDISTEGFIVRDFLKHNNSRAGALERRAAKSRGGSGRAKKQRENAQQEHDTGHSNRPAPAKADEPAEAEQNGLQNDRYARGRPLPLPLENPLPVPEPLPKDAARNNEAEEPGTAPPPGVGQADHAAGSNGAGAGSGHEVHSSGHGDLDLHKVDAVAELAKVYAVGAVGPGEEPA